MILKRSKMFLKLFQKSGFHGIFRRILKYSFLEFFPQTANSHKWCASFWSKSVDSFRAAHCRQKSQSGPSAPIALFAENSWASPSCGIAKGTLQVASLLPGPATNFSSVDVSFRLSREKRSHGHWNRSGIKTDGRIRPPGEKTSAPTVKSCVRSQATFSHSNL